MRLSDSPVATVLHWLVTTGLLVSVVSFANDTENKTIQNETQLQLIQEQQKEIKEDVKEGRQEQKKILELLYKIDSRVKK